MKRQSTTEISEEDLLAFMAGEASAELRKRIADEMEREGSFTQRWLRCVQSAAADPFNVDWAALLQPGIIEESPETAEIVHEMYENGEFAGAGGVGLTEVEDLREKEPEPATISRYWYFTTKRWTDVVLAAILLVLTGPLIVLCALLVKLTSRGPALYRQVHLGKNGRLFRLYKIRTMEYVHGQEGGPTSVTVADRAVNLVGRFLRRSRLYRMPHLWNVLRGDMSLVGPQPEVHLLARYLPAYAARLVVLPGITGLAQVWLRSHKDSDNARRRLAYDLYYIQNQSAWLDLRILIATVLPWVTHLILPVPEQALMQGLTSKPDS